MNIGTYIGIVYLIGILSGVWLTLHTQKHRSEKK